LFDLKYYEYMTTQYFVQFFYPFKTQGRTILGVLSCCLTSSILFNFRYRKNKNLRLIYFNILTG
jgi:hypothetical protein